MCREETAAADLGSDVVNASLFMRAATETCSYTCHTWSLHLLWTARWLLEWLTPEAPISDSAHMRSAHRGTRRLEESAWLPEVPEAHVSSSLHPTLQTCILTKHLAVSAPVHHSGDPSLTTLFSSCPLSLLFVLGENCVLDIVIQGVLHRQRSFGHAYSLGSLHVGKAGQTLKIKACQLPNVLSAKMLACWKETPHWTTPIYHLLPAVH